MSQLEGLKTIAMYMHCRVDRLKELIRTQGLPVFMVGRRAFSDTEWLDLWNRFQEQREKSEKWLQLKERKTSMVYHSPSGRKKDTNKLDGLKDIAKYTKCRKEAVMEFIENDGFPAFRTERRYISDKRWIDQWIFFQANRKWIREWMALDNRLTG